MDERPFTAGRRTCPGGMNPPARPARSKLFSEHRTMLKPFRRAGAVLLSAALAGAGLAAPAPPPPEAAAVKARKGFATQRMQKAMPQQDAVGRVIVVTALTL